MGKTRKKDMEPVNVQMSEGGRMPPQAVDVERSVLGSMLLDKEAVSKVLEFLDVASFYSPLHQKIFRSMMSLFEKADPIDTVTVIEEMRRRGELNAVEDPVYITELTRGVSSAANVEYHSRIVLEKAFPCGKTSGFGGFR